MFLTKLVLKSWSRIGLVSVLLLPLSALYWVLLSVHRGVHHLGFLKRQKAVLPTIVVGNLSVGGTGKTPLVIHIVEHLKNQGFKPGVVSRGYKADSQESMLIDANTAVSIAGDEPYLIARRTCVPIAIGSKRHASIDLLREICDVIVCDDGLQHWPLQADVEVCINDSGAGSNPFLLPAGPWRESQSRLKTIDIIVERDCESAQDSQFSMTLESFEPRNLLELDRSFPDGQIIHAVAGIAKPKRFFDTCESLGLSIVEHPYSDHHQFSESDLNFAQEEVLMTEKDAVKCIEFAKPNYWYLPVSAKLSADFDSALINKLKQAIKLRL